MVTEIALAMEQGGAPDAGAAGFASFIPLFLLAFLLHTILNMTTLLSQGVLCGILKRHLNDL